MKDNSLENASTKLTELAKYGCSVLSFMEENDCTLYEAEEILKANGKFSLYDIYRLTTALDFIVGGAREWWTSEDEPTNYKEQTDTELAEKIMQMRSAR